MRPQPLWFVIAARAPIAHVFVAVYDCGGVSSGPILDTDGLYEI